MEFGDLMGEEGRERFSLFFSSFRFSLRLYVIYWEALTERGTFFRLQFYERIRISLVGVYERVGRSVILACEKVQKG